VYSVQKTVPKIFQKRVKLVEKQSTHGELRIGLNITRINNLCNPN